MIAMNCEMRYFISANKSRLIEARLETIAKNYTRYTEKDTGET